MKWMSDLVNLTAKPQAAVYTRLSPTPVLKSTRSHITRGNTIFRNINPSLSNDTKRFWVACRATGEAVTLV